MCVLVVKFNKKIKLMQKIAKKECAEIPAHSFFAHRFFAKSCLAMLNGLWLRLFAEHNLDD